MRRPMPLPLYALTIFMLLTAVAFSVTVAQPAPSQCPEGEIYLPDQGICVPAEDVPTPEPTATLEPTPLPAGNLASFTLYHLACDDDFDPNGVRDAGGLGSANGCLTFGKPPFSYTISANGIPITSATLDATERDFARLDVPAPIPAGTLTIAIAPVADYTTEFISCGLEIGEAGTDVIEPTISGGSATLSTLPDQKVECWVYNVNRQPVAQDQNPGEDEVVGDGNVIVDPEVDESGTVDNPAGTTGATITIAAYLCPAGVTATDDLIAACTQRASGLAFSLLTANETLETQTSDAEGDIFYSGVPANDYGIAAAVPAGYGEPIVICYVADPIGNVFEGQRDVVFGNQIRLQLGDGFSAECAWYNVPAAGPDNGPNVFIQAWKCGAGIQITPSMTVSEAEQLCGVVYQNKPFQVLFDGQALATKQTNDDPLSSGQAFFTKLPAPSGGGIYGITTTLAEGERTLGVFCDQNYGGDRFVTVTTSVTDGNRIDQELLEGWTLRCSWFIDVSTSPVGTIVATAAPQLDPTSAAATQQAMLGTLPAAQTGLDPTSAAALTATTEAAAVATQIAAAAPHTLTLQFWTCPAGTDPAAAQADLVTICTTETEARAFTLAIDGDVMPQTVTGGATWEFLDPTIAADIGPGLASSAWCGATWPESAQEGTGVADSVALDGGVLTITVSRPQTAVSCEWFLFPG